ncbi:MAG: hypothetical protein GXY89_07705 [Tissierellia bacterium]|nr:hypothetical protein [Tissierellia bacterium]
MNKAINLPMRVFSVTGVSTSGKTTVVEELVRELTLRGYSVGTVKSIGCGRDCEIRHKESCSTHQYDDAQCFTIDTKGKNTHRHKMAGAKQVSTWSKAETAIIYPYRMRLHELIENYDFDFLIIEGGKNEPLPRIVTGFTEENTEMIIGNTTFAISGKIADKTKEINGIKTFRTHDDIVELVDYVIEKVHPTIGYKDEMGCRLCGMTCGEMNSKILNGEKVYTDCIREYPKIEVNSNDKDLKEKLRKLLVQLEEEDFLAKIKIKLG